MGVQFVWTLFFDFSFSVCGLSPPLYQSKTKPRKTRNLIFYHLCMRVFLSSDLHFLSSIFFPTFVDFFLLDCEYKISRWSATGQETSIDHKAIQLIINKKLKPKSHEKNYHHCCGRTSCEFHRMQQRGKSSNSSTVRNDYWVDNDYPSYIFGCEYESDGFWNHYWNSG